MQDSNIQFEKICPEMSQEDFCKFINPVVMEFYEHGNTKDVLVRNLYIFLIFLKKKLFAPLMSSVNYSFAFLSCFCYLGLIQWSKSKLYLEFFEHFQTNPFFLTFITSTPIQISDDRVEFLYSCSLGCIFIKERSDVRPDAF